MSSSPPTYLEKQHQGSAEDVKHYEGSVTSNRDVEAANAQFQHRDVDDGLDHKEVARVVRRVDWRLLPILGAMYTISQVDRTNLGLARSANNGQMNKDLGLSGTNNRYSLITLAFFIPYLVLEVPSQVGLRKFGAKLWLATAVVCWGLVMVGMGMAPTWSALAGLRALLGTFEAVLFPGATYLIACWYPRKQMALRNTVFYVTSICISGLAAALAYGLSKLHGRLGHSGWRWIFIVEGAITCGIGLLGYLLIVDFPDKATFLTPEERELVMLRIERDRADSVPDELTWKKLGNYLLTPKLWAYGYFFFAAAVAVYALAFFLPTILASMNFTNAQAQLLVAPPYVWIMIPALIGAYISDKYCGPNTMIRGPVLAFHFLCIVLGVCMFSQLPTNNVAGRYIGVFLACGGANSNVALTMAWGQSSIRAQSKRGFSSALTVAGGALSGIVVGVSFKESESKQGYPTGIWLAVGLNAVAAIVAIVLSFWMLYRNRRADRGEVVIENDPNFRYQP